MIVLYEARSQTNLRASRLSVSTAVSRLGRNHSYIHFNNNYYVLIATIGIAYVTCYRDIDISNWRIKWSESHINVAVNTLVDSLVRNCQASNETISCSRPNITRLNFEYFVSIPNGTNRTLSCEIHSDTLLKEEPFWRRDRSPSLPAGHSVDNSSCSFSTDKTCVWSNLTLIHVVQGRYRYEENYTLTAENDCGNTTIYVKINIICKFHLHFCGFLHEIISFTINLI